VESVDLIAVALRARQKPQGVACFFAPHTMKVLGYIARRLPPPKKNQSAKRGADTGETP
jgi:hypothetical protein